MGRPKEVSQDRLNEIMARRGGKGGGEALARCSEGTSGKSVEAGAASAENTPVNGGSTESPTLGEGAVTDAVKLGTVTPAASATSGATPSSEDSVSQPAESSGPRELLQWCEPVRASDHTWWSVSTDRKYSIHANRQGKGWTYTPYRRTEEWNNLLGQPTTKEKAIGICEDHARGHREGA